MSDKLVSLYLAGKSLPMIAEDVGLSVSTVRKYIKLAGVLRSRSDAVRLAAEQGRLGSGLRGKTRSFSEETRARMSASARRNGELTATGVSVKPTGYVEFTRGEHKGRRVHVVLVEESIGRRLLPDEVVHHKDEVRSNNDPSNLQLMTRANHSRHHGLKNINSRERGNDGRLK